LALDVTAIRESHSLSGSKAVLILLTPMLAVIVTVGVAVILIGSALHFSFIGLG
jgi:uncharacterized membrane protein